MKPLFYWLLFAILFTSCKSTSTITNKTNGTPTLVNQIINTAIENIGIPYKTAGTNKSGFDCSGLVYTTFAQYNIKLPRSSFEQSKIGKYLGQNLDKAQKGDLLFFKTNKSTKINHVGIVTEASDKEVKFIHSSTSKGVIISSANEPYYQKTFVQLNRILD